MKANLSTKEKRMLLKGTFVEGLKHKKIFKDFDDYKQHSKLRLK